MKEEKIGTSVKRTFFINSKEREELRKDNKCVDYGPHFELEDGSIMYCLVEGADRLWNLLVTE